MDESQFNKSYLLNILGSNNDAIDLSETINSFLFCEWVDKIDKEKKTKYIYNSPVKITQQNVIQWFYFFYLSYGNGDADSVKKCINQLTIFAQLIFLEEFNEFYQYNVPKMLVNLFSINDTEIHYKLISFMTELGRSPEQSLFEPIIKCSFFENIIQSAFRNMSNESFIRNILEFFQVSCKNFKCAQTEILRNESLNLLTNIILNSYFPEKLRKLPIEILSELSQFPDTNSLQKTQICDFFISICKIKSFTNQKFLIDILEIFKLMIKNNDIDKTMIRTIQSICLNLMMESKNVAILTNSILIINFQFDEISAPMQILSEEIQYERLLTLSKNKNSSLSRASLILINNIMKNDTFLYNYFFSNNIIPIIISKFEGDFKLKAKYAAVLVMSTIIMNGTIEQQLICVQSDFIHYLLEFISIDIEKFIFTAMPPLMTLLEKVTTDSQFSFIWELFDEEDGFQIISSLKDSKNEGVPEYAESIIDSINGMRESLNQ